LAIGLGVERRGHVKLYPGQLEELTPKVASECRISVADDGGWNVMQANNIREEGMSHRCHRVRVAEVVEVSRLGEAVDDR
jgi:hypothetical protein